MALELIAGQTFDLLYKAVDRTYNQNSRFKRNFTNVQILLEKLSRRADTIDRIGQYNVELGLQNDEIREIEVEMENGRILIERLSNISPCNCWYYCCINCYANQLEELETSLKRLLDSLFLLDHVHLLELVSRSRQDRERLDDFDRRLNEILANTNMILNDGGHQMPNGNDVPMPNGNGDPMPNGNGQAEQEVGSSEGRGPERVLQNLLDVVIEVREESVTFKPVLGYIKLSLEYLRPLIKEMELLDCSNEEIGEFAMEMENGIELVRKCSKACVWTSFKKHQFTKKLVGLNDTLRRQLDILIEKVVRKVILDSSTKITEAKINQIGESGITDMLQNQLQNMDVMEEEIMIYDNVHVIEEEAVISDNVDVIPEERLIFDNVDVIQEEIANPDNVDVVPEETAISDNVGVIEDEEIMTLDNMNVIEEETVISDNMDVILEETANSDNVDMVSEETTVSDNMHVIEEETVITDNLDEIREETANSDNLVGILEETTNSANTDVMLEEAVISDNKDVIEDERIVTLDGMNVIEEAEIVNLDSVDMIKEETLKSDNVDVIGEEILKLDNVDVSKEGTVISARNVAEKAKLIEGSSVVLKGWSEITESSTAGRGLELDELNVERSSADATKKIAVDLLHHQEDCGGPIASPSQNKNQVTDKKIYKFPKLGHVHTLEAIGGAALGAAFSALCNELTRVPNGRSVMFKSHLEDIKFTLDSFQVVFDGIEKHDDVAFLRVPGIEKFIVEMEEGKSRVFWYSRLRPWEQMPHVPKYSQNLFELNAILESLLSILADQVANDHVPQHQNRYQCKVRVWPAVPEPPEFTVGLEEPLEEVKWKLLRDDESMLVVTAPEGTGKTTLAKLFCQDEEVRAKFDKNMIFVAANMTIFLSDTTPFVDEMPFHGHSTLACYIVREICQQAGLPVPAIQDQSDASYWLQDFMKQNAQNPVLLVLDDVTPGSEYFLDNFKHLKRSSNFKILATSTSRFPSFGYELKPLCLEDAMTLFRRSATPPNLPEVSIKQIVECCRGLPEVITVVGRLLWGQPIPTWEKVVKDVKDSTYLHVCLESSIDACFAGDQRMATVKECLLDLASFPEGQNIPVGALIDIWEELYGLHEFSSVAILHELSNRKLVNLIGLRMEAMEGDGCYREHFVTQHGVFRDLAIWKNGQEYQEYSKGLGKRVIIDDHDLFYHQTQWWTQQKDKPQKTRLLSISIGQYPSLFLLAPILL